MSLGTLQGDRFLVKLLYVEQSQLCCMVLLECFIKNLVVYLGILLLWYSSIFVAFSLPGGL